MICHLKVVLTFLDVNWKSNQLYQRQNQRKPNVSNLFLVKFGFLIDYGKFQESEDFVFQIYLSLLSRVVANFITDDSDGCVKWMSSEWTIHLQNSMYNKHIWFQFLPSRSWTSVIRKLKTRSSTTSVQRSSWSAWWRTSWGSSRSTSSGRRATGCSTMTLRGGASGCFSSGTSGAPSLTIFTTSSGTSSAAALILFTTYSATSGATSLKSFTTSSGTSGAPFLTLFTTSSGRSGATHLTFLTTSSGTSGAASYTFF